MDTWHFSGQICWWWPLDHACALAASIRCPCEIYSALLPRNRNCLSKDLHDRITSIFFFNKSFRFRKTENRQIILDRLTASCWQLCMYKQRQVNRSSSYPPIFVCIHTSSSYLQSETDASVCVSRVGHRSLNAGNCLGRLVASCSFCLSVIAFYTGWALTAVSNHQSSQPQYSADFAAALSYWIVWRRL